ncbi:hypothetical protein [Amycolatopsis vancoresmycina]
MHSFGLACRVSGASFGDTCVAWGDPG